MANVPYPVEQFDTNNEYNADTSTFIPREDGIYSFIASIFTTGSGERSAEIDVRVNGNLIAFDNEEFSDGNFVVSVSTILQLQAGDQVEVFAGGLGEIDPFQAGTHFEGTRTG